MLVILLIIIFIIHTLFFLSVMLIPFFGNNLLLIIYLIIIPCVIIHWCLNDDKCCFTDLEYAIRRNISGQNITEEGFIARILNPIFNLTKSNKDYSPLIYTTTVILWLIAISKLGYNIYNTDMYSFHDFFFT